MRKYTPVGLTSAAKNLLSTMFENFNRISASINSIQTRIGSTDNTISRVNQDGVSNSADIVINADNISNNTTDIGTNTTNIGINATAIGTNATNISTNAGDTTNLEARSSLTYMYTIDDVTTPLATPSAGGLNIYSIGKDIKIHENPLVPGATLPDITGVIGIELYFGGTKYLALEPTSIVDSGSYFTIGWTNQNGNGAISVSDSCTVTFHW